MSEYQYCEFLAVDRPLSVDDQRALRGDSLLGAPGTGSGRASPLSTRHPSHPVGYLSGALTLRLSAGGGSVLAADRRR